MRTGLIVLTGWLVAISIIDAHAKSSSFETEKRFRPLITQELIAQDRDGSATICVTQFGSCPFTGPKNVPCTCANKFGTYRGVSR